MRKTYVLRSKMSQIYEKSSEARALGRNPAVRITEHPAVYDFMQRQLIQFVLKRARCSQNTRNKSRSLVFTTLTQQYNEFDDSKLKSSSLRKIKENRLYFVHAVEIYAKAQYILTSW